MKILIYCPSKFNLNSKNNDKLGGIETLNLESQLKNGTEIFLNKFYYLTLTYPISQPENNSTNTKSLVYLI